jgi:hypothetical protein
MDIDFELYGGIKSAETIARVRRSASFLNSRSASAEVVGENEKELPMFDSVMVTIRLAEIHWYEVHGIGKVRMKIKRYLD